MLPYFEILSDMQLFCHLFLACFRNPIFNVLARNDWYSMKVLFINIDAFYQWVPIYDQSTLLPINTHQSIQG